LLQLLECYVSENMTSEMKRELMQNITEGIFQEFPTKKDKPIPKSTPRSRSAVQLKGSDSDSGLVQDDLNSMPGPRGRPGWAATAAARWLRTSTRCVRVYIYTEY
jgi:hypothetical protein